MALHFALYVGLLLLVMPAWQAGVFILVHQGVMGFYMGSVFAPNHKGMLIVEPGMQLDFLRQQVLTTRNIKPHPLTDFLYGGLNYQIEHHLFPNLPRNNLKAAKPIVQAFCAERGIAYYETGVLQSYAEVARYLHEVANPAREPGALRYVE
jgi:fatty acid desaturase